MSKRFLLTLSTLLVIALIAGGAIFLAKGYTFSPKTGKIQGTGILSITSLPEGASIYLDDHLTTATNATISLSPNKYKVRVVKEGTIPWEREVDVQEGLVTDLKITLFPAIPTIYPLTFNGAAKPLLSPDGQKLAFVVPTATLSGTLKQKGGIWVWSMVSQPISFVRGGEPHQLVASTPSIDYSQATLRFSPDSKQILASFADSHWLLNTDSSDQTPSDVTPTVALTRKAWDEDQKTRDAALLATIKDPTLQKIASNSAALKWAPDETMFMIATGSAKVYDLTDSKTYDLPAAKNYTWLPDSRHVVLVQEGKIAIADFDGTNPAVIWAGNFLDNFALPWPDSSRLVIISTFPTPTASQPNFYGINLK